MGAYQQLHSTVQDGFDEGIAATVGEGDRHVVVEAIVKELLCVAPSQKLMGWLIYGGNVYAVENAREAWDGVVLVKTRKDN